MKTKRVQWREGQREKAILAYALVLLAKEHDIEVPTLREWWAANYRQYADYDFMAEQDNRLSAMYSLATSARKLLGEQRDSLLDHLRNEGLRLLLNRHSERSTQCKALTITHLQYGLSPFMTSPILLTANPYTLNGLKAYTEVSEQLPTSKHPTVTASPKLQQQPAMP